MKKIFLNESEKQKIIADKEKAIMESFAKTYNKIKRIDENDISGQPNWEEMWEDSPKDMKTLMYFSKNMPKDLWKNFLETHRTDIQIAQAEFKSLKKKYGSSSMYENDGLDIGELGRQERSVQYGIDPYQEQPDLTPQEGDTYTNVNVLTQDGTYEKRNVTVVSVYPENREALVRTDAGGDAIVSFDDLNELNEAITGNLNVLFPDWLTKKLNDVHTKVGQGSIFAMDVNKIIEIAKQVVSKEQNIEQIANSTGTISTNVNNVGYDLVLPIEKAKKLPNAQITKTNKVEGPTTMEVPAVKTSAPLQSFKTNQLTIIVRPMKNDAGEIVPNGYIILSVFPGNPNIPRISEWNGKYAVIIPTK